MAQDLSLSYSNSETIINKANFSIDSGSFIFITGASGSGKSTLLKSLYGALKPKQGSLIVGGVELRGVSTSKLNFLRRHIGIVFQDYKLVKEWTIEKNIMLPLIINGYEKGVTQNQVDSLLKHVRLKHQAGKYPLELSGGEQQRVAMARALAHNPILILADEPTGNLDEQTAELVFTNFVDLLKRRNVGALVATHNTELAARMDRVVRVHDRGLIEE